MDPVSEEIESLFALMEKGAITEAEFQAQKRRLLGGLETPSTTNQGESRAAAGLTGQRIGEYRLERQLGEGGMGTVYLATHEALGQQVAVKVLDAALARSPEVRERFLQEARIQIGLRHPGIVQVLTASTEGEHLALVMEYVDGLSAAQVVERRGALPVEEALDLFEKILSAVGHAHSEGIVHRDLKPSNVMVCADGTTKVMDFGIAKVVGGARLTRTGTIMGSAHYMSPEQIVGSADIDFCTDIYSLGVTFYEMLTGQVPFEEMGASATDSDFLIKQAHVQIPAPDPRKMCPELPGELAKGLLRALNKVPRDRFGSCHDFWVSMEGGGEAFTVEVGPADDTVDMPLRGDESIEDSIEMVGSGEEVVNDRSTQRSAWQRAQWVGLVATGGIAGAALIAGFRDRIEEVVLLAAFLPVVLVMGDHVGIQSATITVRRLATRHVHLRGHWKVLLKELRIGVLLAVFGAVLVGLAAFVIGVRDMLLGLMVGCAILSNMAIAALLGTLIPLAFLRIRVDPAAATGPIMTTILDVVGILIYFLIVSAVLSL